MAITISGAPQTFMPVYNPIVYYLDSDNKTNGGFNYVADIYSAGTSTRIASIKVLPRPIDGLGVFNINQLLENEVTYTIPQVIDQFETVPLNFVRYDVEFGEEYFVEWPYSSVSQGQGFFSGFTVLSGTTPSPFINGDNVIIYPNVSTPGLEGYSSVIGSGLTSILIVTPWDNAYTAATASSGVVRFANGNKTLFPNLASSTGNTAFNGAVSHIDYIDYDANDYTLTITGGTSKNLLTNVPDYYPIKNNNDMFLQMKTDYETTILNNIVTFLLITTWEGDPTTSAQVGEYAYSAATFPLTGVTIQHVNVGPQAITDFDAPVFVNLGTLPIFKPSIKYYSIEMLSNGGPISRKYFFTLNKNCFKFNNIELIFQDRLGSLIPANFEVNSIRRINWNQSTYDTYMGDLQNGKYAYETYDRGTNIINTTVTEELDINSDWIDDSVAEYWQELFTSPLVFLKENGQYSPVIIKNTSKEILNKNNKKNISYNMTIQYAYNNRVQNGK
jgi:hypothetical protein